MSSWRADCEVVGVARNQSIQGKQWRGLLRARPCLDNAFVLSCRQLSRAGPPSRGPHCRRRAEETEGK